MKILVLSDSHGSKNNMLDAVSLESPDMILHLGDCEKDCSVLALRYPDIPLRKVRGNCDRLSPELDTDEFKIEDKRFMMTHGHVYNVKIGNDRIIEIAGYRGADVLLYGHTHIPHHSVVEGIEVINPGSIGSGKSYAVLEVKNGAVSCELKTL